MQALAVVSTEAEATAALGAAVNRQTPLIYADGNGGWWLDDRHPDDHTTHHASITAALDNAAWPAVVWIDNDD